MHDFNMQHSLPKVDGHFWNVEVSGQDESPDKVVSAVASRLEGGDLGAGDDDRLAQVLQHEGQGRRRVSHRVRAVHNDEPVKELVSKLDVLGYRDPVILNFTKKTYQKTKLII